MRAVVGVLALSAGVLSYTLATPSAEAQNAPAGQGGAAQGAPGRGGPPPPPENLKVLPKDWTRPQVQQLMQTFNQSLGVMCNHCHVPNPGAPPGPDGRGPQLNYALDDKEEKQIARRMISMVMDINKTTASIGEKGVAEKVTCFTCHNGAETPKKLPDGGWGRGNFTLLPPGPTVPARGARPGGAAPGGAPAPAGN